MYPLAIHGFLANVAKTAACGQRLLMFGCRVNDDKYLAIWCQALAAALQKGLGICSAQVIQAFFDDDQSGR
jgi:hypothetical protein